MDSLWLLGKESQFFFNSLTSGRPNTLQGMADTPRSIWTAQIEVDGLLNFKTRGYKVGDLGGR